MIGDSGATSGVAYHMKRYEIQGEHLAAGADWERRLGVNHIAVPSL